jgi:hypothetical protein
MTHFILFITLAFTTICFGQTPKIKYNKRTLKVTADTIITLGWQDETVPILEFEELGKNNFLEYKRQFRNKLEKDLSKITSVDTTFTIYTSKAKLTYNTPHNKHMGQRGFRWAEYIGYINSLNLFVLELWSEGEFTIGDLFLVDSVSNIQYMISSHSDAPAIIVLSPSNQFIASYSNTVTMTHSDLQIIKVNKIKDIVTYKQFARAEFQDLLILDLVWINSNSIALKVNRPVYNHQTEKYDDNFSYVKAKLSNTKVE